MKKIWKLASMAAIVLVMTGCVSNRYDSTQEGSTLMDNTVCQNGICTTTDKESAPVPSTLPPLLQSPEKLLPRDNNI
ncbi:MAG: hypothetical protein ACNA7Y_06125 [Gammaproteobacteria bacterium]